MKNGRIVRCLILFVTASTLCFIFANSIRSAEQSVKQSDAVAAIVEPIVKAFIGPEKATDFMIHFDLRNSAHFSEFLMLGAELGLMLVFFGWIRIQSIVNALSFCLAIAVADESVQILTGRGPEIVDVLCDISGSAVGISAVLFLYWIRKKIRRRKGQKPIPQQ